MGGRLHVLTPRSCEVILWAVSVDSRTHILSAEGISKRFGAVMALRDIRFAVAKGEIRALCGENGAGKSSLVKIFMGVHRADAGTIQIDGVAHQIATPQAAQTLGLAMVAQELSLAPHLSIHDNIWLEITACRSCITAGIWSKRRLP